MQYRTRVGNCRRCLRLLPPKVEFLIPPPVPQEELPGDDRQLFEKWPNRETVENIGQRIRQLRESRGMTQSQLQARSRVSRSYLSRIESGQMTPSLGTLGENLRSARRRSEPLLHSRIEWRGAARGSLHPGTAAVPAPTRLGTVAIDSEEAASHRRPRLDQRPDAHHAAAAAAGCGQRHGGPPPLALGNGRPPLARSTARTGSARAFIGGVAPRPHRRGQRRDAAIFPERCHHSVVARLR